MFKTIRNALKTPDVRKRILYTLLLIVIFRLGCYITVPGVNSITLNEAMSSNNGVAGLIDMISGGAFSRFSVFAMSISPYITASIVIQLLGMIIPSLEKLTKEGGEEGRRIKREISSREMPVNNGNIPLWNVRELIEIPLIIC